MKETIYTIPLSESLEQNSECPFCFLENKIEQNQIEYSLGPAMMEPEHRILSNERGYCRRHMGQLAEAKAALPFALVLDTRIDWVLEQLEAARGGTKSRKKQSVFSKRESVAACTAKTAEKLTASCLVCERIAHTMSKFTETFWYLCRKEPDFRDKILSGKGFCLYHFKEILESEKKCGGRQPEGFVDALIDLEIENLKRNKKDVHGFVKQFDYRSSKENQNVPKNAHLICAGKLSGF